MFFSFGKNWKRKKPHTMPRTGAYASSARSAPVIDPTSLKQSTVLWLDSSDTNTLFSDAAGTQAMTSDNKVRCWVSKSTLKANKARSPEVGGDGTAHATYVPGLLKGGTLGAFRDTVKGVAMLLDDNKPLVGSSGFTVLVVLQADYTAKTSVIAPVNTFALGQISWCCHYNGPNNITIDEVCAGAVGVLNNTAPQPVFRAELPLSVAILQKVCAFMP